MDLTYPPEAEAFRVVVRQWLAENLPENWETVRHEMTAQERTEFNKAWPQKMIDGGWFCATWPKDLGGMGLSTMEAVAMNEEFAAAGASLRADFFGDTLVGPTILQWGSDEQKQEFIPMILEGKVAWCQGFSEPDAGSDLAALKTSAVRDGDEFVINGQKIWTTQGLDADFMFALCRTDPDASKHKGISYLLVPMDQEGVEVRRIVQPDGGAEFCEVFFTDARCPTDNVVGGLNNGWKVAMTTLGFERGTSATTSYRRFLKEWEGVRDLAQERGLTTDPLIRQRLAATYSRVQIMRYGGLRSLSNVVQKRKDPGVSALGATNKLNWSTHHQDVMELAMDIAGMDGQILQSDPSVEEAVPGYGRRKPAANFPCSPLQSSFFMSRSETIWGGTSQIQKNIVGERVLGLPKEPRV